MTARIEIVQVDGGLEITRLTTNDISIVVPSSHQGMPVVSLGPQFLRDSHASGNRTLVIPSTIAKASEEAMVSVTGIRAINYLGDFETFNSFGWTLSTDCQVTCADGFSFFFLAGYPMCFPRFDDEILTSHQRISEEVVMARLMNPVHLTDDNRVRYEHYLRNRVVPMAEHAMMENDVNALRSVIDSGLLSEGDIRKLLEDSVRSGKTVITSVLMSILNQMHSKQESLDK